MCLVLGLTWPKHRDRHMPHASPTPENTVNRAHHTGIVSDNGSPSAFPSHPAVRRCFRKQSSGTSLRQYDPRTETPFPNLPMPGETISLSCLKSTAHSGQMNPRSRGGGGSSTPARDRLPSRRGPGNTPNSIIATNQTIHPTSMDCSLTIPEPLLLRARVAGRAPPLRPKLAKFPLPKSGSSSTGDLTHPNKLFQDLDKHGFKSAASLATSSPLSLDTDPCTPIRPRPSSSVAEQDPNRKLACQTMGGRVAESAIREKGEDKSKAKEGQSTKVARCMDGTQAVYSQGEEKTIASVEESAKKSTNSSTELFSDSTLSTKLLSTTPPTSPLRFSEATHSVRSVAAIDKAQVDHSFAIPTRLSSRGSGNLNPTALPTPSRVLKQIPDHGSKESEPHDENETKSKPPGKARPARLKLDAVPKTMSFQKRIQRHSMSSLQSMLTPLVKSKHPSIQASSIYSRDTRGVSYMQSPVATFFGDHGGVAESNAATQQQAPLRQTSSLELLKCKIDNWNLDIDELQFPLTPSSDFKRTISNANVRSPTFPRLTEASPSIKEDNRNVRNDSSMVVPAICVARPSDDIFRDPIPNVERGRVLRRVLDMEMAESASHYDRTPSPGSAPGGSDWI